VSQKKQCDIIIPYICLEYLFMRHRQRYNSQAAEHVKAFNEFSQKLGPVVKDVQAAFFDLPSSELDDLLSRYGQIYGAKPEQYARETFQAWKSRSRKMSGQTIERLLNLVPKYLSYDERYEITKRLCEFHSKKESVHIRINKENVSEGVTKLDEALKLFEVSDLLKALPEHVTDSATWLNDDDIIATRALLAKIEQEETAIIKAITERNRLPLIELLYDDSVKNLNETIEFPTGTIHINLYKDSFCVVASYVYESSEHQNVLALRKFRDQTLVNLPYGQAVINSYYKNGMNVVKLLKKNTMLAKFIKFMLNSFVNILKIGGVK
jgi:hypothetical protein